MSGGAAFFDVDRTVLEVNSGSLWMQRQWRAGELTVFEFMRSIGWLAQYHFGLLDFDAMAERALVKHEGTSVAELREVTRSWFIASIAQHICVEARATVQMHQQKGHRTVLLSSATRYLCEPLAEILGISDILCTELEESEGCLTGKHRKPACYGAGKVIWAEQFAEREKLQLSESYFYSDSISDLPMLEAVGNPRVVNPDPRLRRLAQKRGWNVSVWQAEKTGNQAEKTA